MRKIFKKKKRSMAARSGSVSSRRATSSKDVRIPMISADTQFAHLSESQLNEQLTPFLATLNVDGSKFDTMQRKAKEEILKQCLKRSSSKTSLNSETGPLEIAQRFIKIASTTQYDCSTILKELKDLRIFVQSEDLDWLKQFCKAGGASALMNVIDRLSELMETNLSSTSRTVDDQTFSSIILEHLKCVRALLNNQCGRLFCCGPSVDMCGKLVNLLRVCNKTLQEVYDPVKKDLFRLFLVIMWIEESQTKSAPGFQLIMNGIESVARKYRQPRFQILVNCLECEAITLYTLRFITVMFDQIEDEDWEVRVLWRRDLWTAGFDRHYDRLCASHPKGEHYELLTRIGDQWKVDAQNLNKKNYDVTEKIEANDLIAACEKCFEESDCTFVWNDILVRLLVLSTTSSDVFKDATIVRNFISELTFFGDDFNKDLQTQRKFSDELLSLSVHSDVAHLKARLQRAVDEKQQVQSYQDAYFSNIAKLQSENEQLRAHIQNPSLPIPAKSTINLVPPENFKPSSSPPPPPPTAPSSGPPKSSAPPPPPPTAASLRANGGPPMPSAKTGGPPPPPPPPPSAASLRTGGTVPPPPGPPPPLGAPFGNARMVPQLPSYLQPKNETMPEVATRKIAGWEASKIPPRTIKDNSIWTNFQNVERDFAVDRLYNQLKEKFSRPQSAHVFKRMMCEPVVVTNEKQLKTWEILAARTISDVDCFKRALLRVDLKNLSEDTVALVRGALLEPEILLKLRETPIEKFKNAPKGEKLIATLSRIKDLPNRLRSIQLLLTFKKTAEKLRSNASTFAEACDEIRNSVGLGMFAVLVLVCGNYMMRTTSNRQLCYGYLMHLLPKLVETKDASNKQTLLDHLIRIFDSATNRKYAEFPSKDFVQVERAKLLILSDVVKSVDELNANVKTIVSYQKNFTTQSEDDTLGSILERRLPGYVTEVENLLYLKKSVESKAAEIERYFCFDSTAESKNKYTLEDLIRDIYIFSAYYKASCEKMAKTAEQAKNSVRTGFKSKSRAAVKKEPKTVLAGTSDNLVEQLEENLAANNYRMAKTPRRGPSSQKNEITDVKTAVEASPPPFTQNNKENARPRAAKSKGSAGVDLDSLCLKLKDL